MCCQIFKHIVKCVGLGCDLLCVEFGSLSFCAWLFRLSFLHLVFAFDFWRSFLLSALFYHVNAACRVRSLVFYALFVLVALVLLMRLRVERQREAVVSFLKVSVQWT